MTIFTPEQLGIIESVARQCHATKSGELSVARELAAMGTFDEVQVAVIEFCAEAVRRQDEVDAEIRVLWMVNAYNFVAENWGDVRALTEEDILTLLALVEPEDNARGYRKGQTGKREGPFIVEIGAPPEDIPRRIRLILEHQDAMNPAEFYAEFEGIHPARNGNGRTGQIIFNFLNGTLVCPEFPPEPDFKTQF